VPSEPEPMRKRTLDVWTFPELAVVVRAFGRQQKHHCATHACEIPHS
jgi:hypothetical protein